MYAGYCINIDIVPQQHCTLSTCLNTLPNEDSGDCPRGILQLLIYYMTLNYNFLFTQNNHRVDMVVLKYTALQLEAVLVRVILLSTTKQLWRKLQSFSKGFGRNKYEFTYNVAALLHQLQCRVYFDKVVPLTNRSKQLRTLYFPADKF